MRPRLTMVGPVLLSAVLLALCTSCAAEPAIASAGVSDIGTKASALLKGVAWQNSERHFPTVKMANWDLNGKAEQAYLAGVFRDSGGAGVVLGACLTIVILLSMCILRIYFKGGCCTTGQFARSSTMHKVGTFFGLVLVCGVLGLCGFKVFLGSKQLAVGANAIFTDTVKSSEDAAGFFCANSTGAARMKYSTAAMAGGGVEQRRRRLEASLASGGFAMEVGGVARWASGAGRRLDMFGGVAGGSAMDAEALREIRSNAKHCGPTSLAAFLGNVTGKVGHELTQVLAFVDTLHGATPPLGKVVGYLKNVGTHINGIGALFDDTKSNLSAVEAEITKAKAAGLPLPLPQLPDMSKMDASMFTSARAKIQQVETQAEGMYKQVRKGLDEMTAPMKKKLGGMNDQIDSMAGGFTQKLISMQNMALQSGKMVASIQATYTSSYANLQTTALGALALVPFAINCIGLLGYVLGCCCKTCRCSCFNRCSAYLVFAFLFWFALIGGVFRAVNALMTDVCAERYGLIKFYTQDMNIPLRTSNLNLSGHIVEALRCNESTPAPSNLVDIFHLRQELNVSSMVAGATAKVAAVQEMLNKTDALDSAMGMMGGIDAMLNVPLAEQFNASQIMAQIAKADEMMPPVDSDGKLNMSDSLTQEKLKAAAKLMGGDAAQQFDIAVLQTGLASLNDMIALSGDVTFKPYTLDTMDQLNKTALEHPPFTTLLKKGETQMKPALDKLNSALQQAGVANASTFTLENYKTTLTPDAVKKFPFRGPKSLEHSIDKQVQPALDAINAALTQAQVQFTPFNASNYITGVNSAALEKFPFKGTGSFDEKVTAQLQTLLKLINAALTQAKVAHAGFTVTNHKLTAQAINQKPFTDILTSQDPTIKSMCDQINAILSMAGLKKVYTLQNYKIDLTVAKLGTPPLSTLQPPAQQKVRLLVTGIEAIAKQVQEGYKKAGQAVSGVVQIDDQVKKLPTGVELVETAVRAVQSELKNVDAMVAELAKGQDQVKKQMKDARQMIDGVEKVNKIIAQVANMSKTAQSATAAIGARVQAIGASLGQLGRITGNIAQLKTNISEQLNISSASMKSAGKDLKARVKAIEAIPPFLMNSAGDYVHCGWIGKAFNGIVEKGVCTETQKGLDEISKWLIGSVCVFFLSFFVQIHAVAVIGATNAFDDEFGHMELSAFDDDDDYYDDTDVNAGALAREEPRRRKSWEDNA